MSETIAAVIGALLGAFATYVIQWVADGNRTTKARHLHLAALSAEIDFNARLAATYLDEQIAAPLYRFPTTVYNTVYAQLLSETLSQADVSALTAFYSQCEQMNRGLDAITQFIADDAGRDAIAREQRRLVAKASEMRHPDQAARRERPESQFYSQAREAVQRHRK